jgi:hypothetical protein
MNNDKRELIARITESHSSKKHAELYKLGVLYQGVPQNQNYPKVIINCFSYALNFHKSEVYCGSVLKSDIPANSNFITFLLKNGILLAVEKPSNLDLVVYFDGRQPKHAAKVIDIDNEVVKSSWGNLGLFKHVILDVPDYYGNIVKFYKPPNLKTTEEWYLKFFQEQLGSVNKKTLA